MIFRKQNRDLKPEQIQLEKRKLYRRVFKTQDGMDVLKDIMNRNFFMYPTTTERESGRRDCMLDTVGYVFDDISELIKLIEGESK